jgi:hypothetical protein
MVSTATTASSTKSLRARLMAGGTVILSVRRCSRASPTRTTAITWDSTSSPTCSTSSRPTSTAFRGLRTSGADASGTGSCRARSSASGAA